MLTFDLDHHLDSEKALNCMDAALVSDIPDVGRPDAEYTLTAVLEIQEQGAIVRADINDRSLSPRPSMAALSLQVGKIVAQQFGGAARVGVFRGKMIAGSTAKPSWTSSQLRQCSSQVGTTAVGAAPPRSAPSG